LGQADSSKKRREVVFEPFISACGIHSDLASNCINIPVTLNAVPDHIFSALSEAATVFAALPVGKERAEVLVDCEINAANFTPPEVIRNNLLERISDYAELVV
jgi:hypothetical protein